jgi:hypothetical protein
MVVLGAVVAADETTVLPNTCTCDVDPSEAGPGKRLVLDTVDEVAPEKRPGVDATDEVALVDRGRAASDCGCWKGGQFGSTFVGTGVASLVGQQDTEGNRLDTVEEEVAQQRQGKGGGRWRQRGRWRGHTLEQRKVADAGAVVEKGKGQDRHWKKPPGRKNLVRALIARIPIVIPSGSD